MAEKWEIEEGVLRGRKLPNGSWEFFHVCYFNQNKGPETFPLDADTPSQARRMASQIEAKELKRYIENRKYFHSQNSFNEGGWVGDLIDSIAGQFLIDEFDIETTMLSAKQTTQLDQDILAISGSFLTEAKTRAKSDLQETRRLLKQIKKQRTGVEKLSRGFRSTANFSPFAAPDETLAKLIFELSENEKAIQENLDDLGRDKSNISSVQLCCDSIDIFLRWCDRTVPEDERGISYGEDFDDLKVLPKKEAYLDDRGPAYIDSELGRFLDKAKISLFDSGLKVWDFSVEEPSRFALRKYEKRQSFVS